MDKPAVKVEGLDEENDGEAPHFDPSRFYIHESSERQDFRVDALVAQFALHMFAPWTCVVFLWRSMTGAAAAQFIAVALGRVELNDTSLARFLLRVTFMSYYWIVPLVLTTALWVCNSDKPYEGADAEAVQALILFTLYCTTVAIKYSSLTVRECARLRRTRGVCATELALSAQLLTGWAEPSERVMLCELELCAAAASTDLAETWVVLRNRTDGTSVRALWESYSREINSLELVLRTYPEIDKPRMSHSVPDDDLQRSTRSAAVSTASVHVGDAVTSAVQGRDVISGGRLAVALLVRAYASVRTTRRVATVAALVLALGMTLLPVFLRLYGGMRPFGHTVTGYILFLTMASIRFAGFAMVWCLCLNAALDYVVRASAMRDLGSITRVTPHPSGERRPLSCCMTPTARKAEPALRPPRRADRRGRLEHPTRKYRCELALYEW